MTRDEQRLASPLLTAIYHWRHDVKTWCNSQAVGRMTADRALVIWWLQWGVANYPQISVEAGVTRKFFLEHIYCLGRSLKQSAPPLYNLLSGTRQSYLARRSSALVEKLYREIYPQLIPRAGLLAEALAGRALIFAMDNPGCVSREAISAVYAVLKNLGEDFRPDNLAERYRPLVNIFGHADDTIGLGVDTKLTLKALSAQGIPARYVKEDQASYAPLNICLMPPPDLAVFLARRRKSAIHGVNVCACPWELPKWPASLEYVLDAFDHIYCYTNFVAQSIPERYRHRTSKIPLPVEIPSTWKKKPRGERRRLRAFVFLSLCDLASFETRKNPRGAITAFRQAFPKGSEPVELRIKLNNAESYPDKADSLRNLANGDIRITFIDKKLTENELTSLYEEANAFVSLHRSEGFGRVIAEMMLMHKPVIVTDYSGNCDFTTVETAWLVPAKIRKLGPDEYIFSEGQSWAEPNETTAAKIMRLVSTRPETARKKAKTAARLIRKRYSLSRAGKCWRNEIRTIFTI